MGQKKEKKRSPILKNGEKTKKKTPEIMSFIYFNLRPFRFAHQTAHRTRMLAKEWLSVGCIHHPTHSFFQHLAISGFPLSDHTDSKHHGVGTRIL